MKNMCLIIAAVAAIGLWSPSTAYAGHDEWPVPERAAPSPERPNPAGAVYKKVFGDDESPAPAPAADVDKLEADGGECVIRKVRVPAIEKPAHYTLILLDLQGGLLEDIGRCNPDSEVTAHTTERTARILVSQGKSGWAYLEVPEGREKTLKARFFGPSLPKGKQFWEGMLNTDKVVLSSVQPNKGAEIINNGQ
jgi:hypothetical protein